MAKLSRQLPREKLIVGVGGLHDPEIWRMDSPKWSYVGKVSICQISNGYFMFEPTQLKSYAISHFLDVEVGCQKSFWGQTNIKEAYFP